MLTNKLILNDKALAEMGFAEEAIYLIEYDMNSPRKISKRATKEQQKHLKAQNKLVRVFRNKLGYILKYNLQATRHLESCWIIDEKHLDTAIKRLERLKDEMKAKGFRDVDKRLRIIPILTTLEGYESYETKKAEWLLEFIMEHIRYMEDAKKAKRASKGLIWRAKRAFEIVSELSNELKNHTRFKEITDTNQALDEITNKVEAIIKAEKLKIKGELADTKEIK